MGGLSCPLAPRLSPRWMGDGADMRVLGPKDTTLNAGDRLLHDGGEQPWEAKGFHAGPAG